MRLEPFLTQFNILTGKSRERGREGGWREGTVRSGQSGPAVAAGHASKQEKEGDEKKERRQGLSTKFQKIS